MDTLIKWAIYAAIAVAVLGSINLAWDHYIIAPAEARGAHLQEAKDAPIIAHWQGEANKAAAANKVLTGDVGELRDRFNALFKEGADRATRSTAAIAAAAARAGKAEAALSAERATLARAPATDSCTGICAKANDELGKAIADEITQ